MPSTTTHVTAIPVCDLCGSPDGYADCQVPAYSTWANVCQPCFKRFGCSLGTGRGQEFILGASAVALDAKRFATWMHEVDRSMDHFCGMTSSDIDDYDYYSSFAQGETPVAAMRSAVEAAGFVL